MEVHVRIVQNLKKTKKKFFFLNCGSFLNLLNSVCKCVVTLRKKLHIKKSKQNKYLSTRKRLHDVRHRDFCFRN